MPVGRCKLCLQTRDLQDSHLLPKALYRLSRFEGAANPNPMMLSERGRVQTSKQVRDYVLCRDCEQRFSANGERYAMSQVNRKGEYALLKALNASDNKRSAGGFTFHYEVLALGIDLKKLAYFAMSVFWRASVHLWHLPERTEPIISLGKYEEPIRKYLLDEEPFPSGLVLLMYVCTDTYSQNVFYLPSVGTENPMGWSFLARGLTFYLNETEGMDVDPTGACIVNGSRNMVVSVSCAERTMTTAARIIEAAKRSRAR
jgi:hypothetical protein